jgi:hypothetical protein
MYLAYFLNRFAAWAKARSRRAHHLCSTSMVVVVGKLRFAHPTAP